ncbi:hypothetical protein QBC44DRAFT_341776 [Cladorrhinum sp. PSN332]|nr:hypothetical protein QBC44DRAFT_341776 [Cladorrhinum sp. PSN332]
MTERRAAHIAKYPAFVDPDLVKNINQDLKRTIPAKYDMKEFPGKGMGLVAKEHIRRGDLVMANTVSLMIDYRAFEELPKEHYTQLQAAAVDYLPEAHREAILALSTHDGTDRTHIQRIDKIAATNAFDIDADEEDEVQDHGFYVVFPEIARMNHDCRPNSDYYFDHDTLTQYIHATRDIFPGEELTLSYINPVMKRKARVRKLQRIWGFECACPLCTQEKPRVEASDLRIRQIKELSNEFSDWEPQSRADPAMAELMISLYEQEKLWGSMYEAYVFAAIEYNGIGEPWTAVKYARLAVEWGIPVVGPKDADVVEMAKMAEDPWGHWSWLKRNKVRVDPAKAIEAIREARPPATDRFTYLTIIEANLLPEVLPTLNEVLHDAELTQEIGWDLVYNLVNLPGSEGCLETIARLGNPREVILKVLETFEVLEQDGYQADGEGDDSEAEKKDATAVSTTQKFILLLGMLAILHKRIKTKYPSRFLAQTLQTVYSAYRPNQELTAAIINLVHSLSGERRPPLPSRKSSINVASLGVEGAGFRNAPDPEADREGREDPTESELQQKLLLSFATCILESYVNGNNMAWAPRLMEFFNPERIVPGRKTFMAAFREDQELLARDAIVGKLVALISDLGLTAPSKSFIADLLKGPLQTAPFSDPPSDPSEISLPTGGAVILLTYWIFSSTIFDASHPSPEIHIFPEHFAILDKFLQDDAHTQIQKTPGTIEAVIAIGLWLHYSNLLGSTTSELDNEQDPQTSDFMKYTHLATLIALFHPNLQVRNAASTLAGLVFRSDPSDEDRLKILYDLLENCGFASLKARAVSWLKEEIISAASGSASLFSTTQALETLQYVVFPNLDFLAEDVEGNFGGGKEEVVEYLAGNSQFLLQAVNFGLFLWGGGGGGEKKTKGKGEYLPENMDAAVRERWFEPLLPKRKRKKALKEKQKHDRYRRFSLGNEHYTTKGKISKHDGRLSISLKDTSNTGYLAKALGQAARKMAPQKKAKEDTPSTAAGKDEKAQNEAAQKPKKDSGLEFFSVGGDPSELMSFMVKNPGMIPTLSTIKSGDISKRRQAMATMFKGFWRACINATDDEMDSRNLKMMGARDPFVADAIIANPPSFAHVHCAEALGIPLHLMFTFPYTPTQAFPHPLARIKGGQMSGLEKGSGGGGNNGGGEQQQQQGYANWISYPLVEMMVWQGLGDLVNEFRVKTLGLDPVSTLWAPGATYRLKVPMTYLWSPGVVAKPEDWGEEVGVEGWVFLELGGRFEPEEGLKKFLEKGEGSGKELVYIGFGSIVVDDADRFTDMIFKAVKKAGVRALVSKGWGGLGAGEGLEVPEDVYMLDNTPHDWLFPRVKACVIHGGAGTTAIALKCGKPTMIVPFFGDQYFWGSMVSNAGAGPEPVPYKELDADKLAEGIKFCLTEEAQEAVDKIAKSIAEEGDGAENACRAFHKGLVLKGDRSMRCAILPDRVATWKMKETGLRLSPVAAEMLVQRGLVGWKKLRLLRHNEWNDFEGPGEPITGITGSIMGTVGNVFGGIGGVPYRVAKKVRRSKEKEKKKRGDKKKKKESGSGNGDEPPPPHVETATAGAIDRRNSDLSTSTLSNPAEEVAHQVGHGALKSAAAIAKAPVDLSLALAQGFHNAPRLYGDDTVRRPTRVTGIKSGLKAAGHEFVFGIYDGWTGVVRLPYRGAKEGGVRGFVTGVGMGLTGFVLKDIAAVVGPVGYTLKGVVKQAERGKQPIKYIRKARMVQGERELKQLSDEGKEEEKVGEEVVKGWAVMWRLWEELERQEKMKGEKSLSVKLGGRHRKARKRREWDVLFESLEVAERSLEGLKRGEDLEVLLKRERELRGDSEKEGKWKVVEDRSNNGSGENGEEEVVKSSEEDTGVDADVDVDVNGDVDGGKKEKETNPFAAAAVDPVAPANEAEIAKSVAGAELLGVEEVNVKA